MSDLLFARRVLPPHSTPLERALVAAVHGEIRAIPHRLKTLYDPWTCPLAALPHLAAAWSVDVWSDRWPESVKRAVVAASLEIHRRKGSVWAARKALEALGVASEIAEWPAHGGTPRTFRVLAEPTIDLIRDPAEALFSVRLMDQIRAAIDAAKPLAAHYDFRLRLRARASVALSGGVLGAATAAPATTSEPPTFRAAGHEVLTGAAVGAPLAVPSASIAPPTFCAAGGARLTGAALCAPAMAPRAAVAPPAFRAAMRAALRGGALGRVLLRCACSVIVPGPLMAHQGALSGAALGAVSVDALAVTLPAGTPA